MRSFTATWVVGGLILAGASQPVAASCPAPFPPLSTAIPLSRIIAKAGALKLKKDEYETTASYQARVAAAASGLPSGDILVTWSAPNITSFDADSGRVTVDHYAAGPHCGAPDRSIGDEAKLIAFGKPGMKVGSLLLGSVYCAGKMVATRTGAGFTATNGFGATTTVKTKFDDYQGLYFGFGASIQPFFEGEARYETEAPAFSFTATVDEAKSLKTNSALIYVGRIRSPFVVRAVDHFGATIQRPVEVVSSFDLLNLEVSCLALGDAKTGRVFASREIVSNAAGPFVSAKPAAGPPPSVDLSKFVTTADYPAFALIMKEEGNTRIRVRFNEAGRAESCQIVASSGSAALDQEACRAIKRRARTMTHSGKFEIEQDVRWKLPAD